MGWSCGFRLGWGRGGELGFGLVVGVGSLVLVWWVGCGLCLGGWPFTVPADGCWEGNASAPAHAASIRCRPAIVEQTAQPFGEPSAQHDLVDRCVPPVRCLRRAPVVLITRLKLQRCRIRLGCTTCAP